MLVEEYARKVSELLSLGSVPRIALATRTGQPKAGLLGEKVTDSNGQRPTVTVSDRQ